MPKPGLWLKGWKWDGIPKALWSAPVGATAKLLYGFLCSVMDDDGVAFPSQTRCQAALGVGSDNTLRSALRELVDNTMVRPSTWEQDPETGEWRPGRNLRDETSGQYRSITYVVLPPGEWKSEREKAPSAETEDGPSAETAPGRPQSPSAPPSSKSADDLEDASRETSSRGGAHAQNGPGRELEVGTARWFSLVDLWLAGLSQQEHEDLRQKAIERLREEGLLRAPEPPDRRLLSQFVRLVGVEEMQRRKVWPPPRS